MNNATSCNVCVFESRNKWEMAACFVVLSSSTASSLGHPLWKALYDIITHLFATKRNMWHIQKPASRMYSTVLQSNPYILEVLRCHSINLMHVSCHLGWPSIVEIGWNIKWFCCVVVSWLWPSIAPSSCIDILSILSWITLYISIAKKDSIFNTNFNIQQPDEMTWFMHYLHLKFKILLVKNWLIGLLI